jgi:hypothetical protein
MNTPATQHQRKGVYTVLVGLFLLFGITIPAHAAFFSIAQSDATLNGTIRLDVQATTEQWQPFNAAAAVITYDPTVLYPVFATTSTSIFKYWVLPPTIDREMHTISFAGGTNALGGFIFTGTLFSVEFFRLQNTTTTLAFSEQEIAAYDGLGTELSAERTSELFVYP